MIRLVWITLHFWKVSVLLCSLVGSQFTSTNRAESTDDLTQYEWLQREIVSQYAQETSFTLLALTVPRLTVKAEIKVQATDSSGNDARLNRTLFVSLRWAGIPLISAYNLSLPESFILPTDQQNHLLETDGIHSLTITSPKPGRVYLMASVLNPLPEVIDNLRWGDKLGESSYISVKALYTVRTGVTSLPVNYVSQVNLTGGEWRTFSFRVPESITAYSVIISNCQTNGSDCPVTMTIADTLAVDDPSAVRVDCRQRGQQQCVGNILSPLVDFEHFVTFSIDRDSISVEDVTFDVSFDFQGCAGMTSATLTTTHPEYLGTWNTALQRDRRVKAVSIFPPAISNATQTCLNLGKLGRVSVPSDKFWFGARFGSWTMRGKLVPEVKLVISDVLMEVKTFVLEDSVDVGGILHISATLEDQFWTGLVWVCAMAQRVPQPGGLEQCQGGALLTLNAIQEGLQKNQQISAEVFVPFPLTGVWYLAMQSQCFGTSKRRPCPILPMIKLQVEMTQCAPSQCGHYGSCQLYMEGTTVYSGCECHAGYRGLACSDDTYGLTKSQQLTAVYLLTLSNLAFIPAIFLAVYRRYFTLAVVFFFNFFFSTFYHACDASKVYQLCIMEYNTLAFGDFFGSIISFYSVLTTMARIPEAVRTFLLMVGALVIAVIVERDRHNDLVRSLPLVLVGLVLIVSWGRQMIMRRRLFPSGRRYLCCLVPGIALAGIGIGVNYGLMWHQSTYQYTHSFWHAAMMLAPCLLMPPRPKTRSAINNKLSISAQDIISAGRPEQQPPQHECEPTVIDPSQCSDQSLLI